MNFAINIEYLLKTMPLDVAAEKLARAGFKSVDYTPTLLGNAFFDELDMAERVFDRYGLSVEQMHAPFNRYGTWGENHVPALSRCALAMERLGAKYMVVHADELPADYNSISASEDYIFKYNYEYFAPFVEEARGYKIAFENLFGGTPERPRYCGKESELEAIIRAYGDAVACCWDFGHAEVAFGKDHAEVLKRLGRHVECTHVHDSRKGHDLHLPPFHGEIDWEQCMGALGDTGYSGALTLELVYGKIPAEVADSFLLNLQSSLSYLKNLMAKK